MVMRHSDWDYQSPHLAVSARIFHSCVGKPAPKKGHLQRRNMVESDRREPVISSVPPQLGDFPNMIHPPLLGVVNAPSAVSARTLTCRAPAVPRSCSMQSVYIAVRVRPFPRLPPLEQSGCGPSTLISPA
jgi:hypothetical protein